MSAESVSDSEILCVSAIKSRCEEVNVEGMTPVHRIYTSA